MLFYILIAIIILLLIYIPSKKNETSLINKSKFNIKRDIFAKTNDLAKYLILK